MTKDVLISVSGLQMGEEKPEQIEVISKGNFYQKNGYSYVFYDEVIEGFDQRVRNMIKFKNGALHVQKKGIVNVNMAFEEEKKNNTCYTTPYGDIMIGIDTAWKFRKRKITSVWMSRTGWKQTMSILPIAGSKWISGQKRAECH